MAKPDHKVFQESLRRQISFQVERLGQKEFKDLDINKDYPVLGAAVLMSVLNTLHSMSLSRNLSPSDLEVAADAALSQLDAIGIEKVETPMGGIVFQWKARDEHHATQRPGGA